MVIHSIFPQNKVHKSPPKPLSSCSNVASSAVKNNYLLDVTAPYDDTADNLKQFEFPTCDASELKNNLVSQPFNDDL